VSAGELTPRNDKEDLAMRFVIFVKGNTEYEAGAMPSKTQLKNMTDYNEQLIKSGVFLAGEGLHPTSTGANIRFRDGEMQVTDGPFAEAKEIVAGFTIIDVASREEALEWLRKWPHSPEDGDFDLQLRQAFAPEDFGEEFAPELQAREAELRQAAERNAAQG
jgi:hypothetical protein